MLCLDYNTESLTYTVANPQPTDLSTCTYLLANPSDFPMDFLTVDDAIQLAFLFASVLVVGFTFRAIAQALKTDERFHND